MKFPLRSLLALPALILVALAATFAFLITGDTETTGIVAAAGLLPIPSAGGSMRAVLEALYARFPNVSKQLITQSYLRVEVPITQSASEYDFPVLRENATNVRPTEVRLEKNDVFVITHLGFYLLQNPVANSIEKYNGALQTYPNPTALAGSSAVADLNVFYHGYWRIEVGSTVFFNKLPNQLTYMVGCSQQVAAVTDSVPAVPASSRAYSDGAPTLQPLAVLSGANENLVRLSIPHFSSFAGQSSNTANNLLYAVFHPYGFLVKNAAQYVRT